MIAWPSSRVISSRSFLRSERPSYTRRTIRPSIRHAPRSSQFANLWPDSKALHRMFISSSTKRAHRKVLILYKNFLRRLSQFARVIFFRVCNNYLGTRWPCLDVMSSAGGKLCKRGTNWISCRDLLDPSYLTSYIGSSATRFHTFLRSFRRYSFFFFSLLFPQSRTRDQCTNTCCMMNYRYV